MIFLWATCACITSFAALDAVPARPLEGHALGEFVQKCEYHRLMEDGEAFAELRSSHLTMALAIKAARAAAYGDELNPIKHHGAVYDFVASFEQEDRKRAVVLNPLFLPNGKDAEIIARAKRESFGHEVRVGDLKPTGQVALFFGCPSNASANGTFAALLGGGASNATETRSQLTCSVAGILSKLAIYNSAGGTTSHTVRVRKNGANGNMLVTQTAAADGYDEDASNTDSISAGDELGFSFTDSGTDPTYSYIRTLFEASSGHSTFYFASRAAGAILDATNNRYIPFAGCIINDGNATEANEQHHIRAAGTASLFQIGVSNNVGVSSRIFRSRLNNANGNMLVTFLAGATGIAIDSVNSDTYAQNDTAGCHIAPLLGTDDITVFNCGVVFSPSSGTKTDLFCRGAATGGGVIRAGSATEHFTNIAGAMVNLSVTSSAERTVKMGYDGRFSDPRIYMSGNPYTSDATCRIRNNTTGQEITVTITAGGGAGLYSNYGATLDFSADDDIFVGWVGGTSGTATVAGFEICQEVAVAADGFGPLLGGRRNALIGGGLLAA